MIINGDTILNLPYEDVDIYKKGYIINTNESTFIIDIIENNSNKELISQFMLREWKSQSYLHCIDENGVKFSLFDCEIGLMNFPTKQLKILWKKIVYGEHYLDDVNLRANSASFLIESNSSKKKMKLFIGKSEIIRLEAFTVETDWRTDLAGIPVGITITSSEFQQLSFFNDIFLRVMELIFLYLGFFAKLLEARCSIKDGNKVLMFEKYSSIYDYNDKSVNSAISLDIGKNVSWNNSFKKWCNIRNKERPTFNLFAFTMGDTENILEVPVATIIQCLEGYMRVHHQDEITKFPQDAKRNLVNHLKCYLNDSAEWRNNCKVNHVDAQAISKSITNMLGHINQMSLQELLSYAINCNDNAEIIFRYEKEHFVNEEKCYYDIILKKISGHRNWLSHLMTQEFCFENEENVLAKAKLALLFRVIMMEDIKLPINEESLVKVVEHINTWYDKNQLTYQRKKHK